MPFFLLKKLYLFLWLLEFSLKNMEFSIKFEISLFLYGFMIYVFYSLGEELFSKSELMVFLLLYNDVKFDMFIYQVSVLDMGFYPIWLV